MTHFSNAALPTASDSRGKAVFLEAEPGPARSALVEAWLAQADGRVLRLDGDVDEHGVWAGLHQLLEALLPEIRERAPHLLEKHAYELCLVLPQLRRELTVRNPCLTDMASDDEKVRNYPNDRAYRSLHGVIDLLDEWHTVDGQTRWTLACDNFLSATPLVRRFFAELVRRRGQRLQLALLLAVSPGEVTQAASLFDPSTIVCTLRVVLPEYLPSTRSGELP